MGAKITFEPDETSQPPQRQITELSPDHRIEYYACGGRTWVRETCNGRTLDQPLDAALMQDAWERLAYFFGGPV